MWSTNYLIKKSTQALAIDIIKMLTSKKTPHDLSLNCSLMAKQAKRQVTKEMFLMRRAERRQEFGPYTLL